MRGLTHLHGARRRTLKLGLERHRNDDRRQARRTLGHALHLERLSRHDEPARGIRPEQREIARVRHILPVDRGKPLGHLVGVVARVDHGARKRLERLGEQRSVDLNGSNLERELRIRKRLGAGGDVRLGVGLLGAARLHLPEVAEEGKAFLVGVVDLVLIAGDRSINQLQVHRVRSSSCTGQNVPLEHRPFCLLIYRR